MKEKFKAKDFDEVNFINSGIETQEILDAKEYLKDFQMTVNIADVSESLFAFENLDDIANEEKKVFEMMKESIFSTNSLNFLEKVKLLTSFEGINPNLLENANFDTPARTIHGYSANVKALYGPRFALLGNAAEFLDPVFSSGVTIGFKSLRGPIY